MPNWTIKTADGGSMDAYVAMPAQTPAPAIIVIQEIFGVNEGVRARCEEYAAKGYLAVAPDLFWRLEPNVDITDKTQAEWDKAFDLMNRFDIDQGVKDLADTLAQTRESAECDGFVADIGFCLGGKLAYLMAARTDVDATVSYYGVGIQDMLNEMDNIKAPTLFHIAGLDKFVPKEAQDAIVAKAAPNDLLDTYVYKDSDHAFTRKGGEHYDAAATAMADAASLALLEKARAAQ